MESTGVAAASVLMQRWSSSDKEIMSSIKTVDVRATAPMHRFDQIMSAYESLAEGEAMQLIVDHDPRCMYYTLRATRGEETFGFEYLEDGPLTWQVVVTRKAAASAGAQ